MKDVGTIEIYGFLKISDPDSGKVFLEKKTDQPLKEIKQHDRFVQNKNNRPPKDYK